MRLLQVIDSLDPETGGPAEHLRNLTPVIEKAGHESHVACFDDPEAAWLNGCGDNVFAFGPARAKFGYSGSFAPWLAGKRSGYDAVIVRGLWQYSSYAVWHTLKGTETPYFVFPHGMLDPWFNRAYPLKKFKKYIYWFLGGYHVLRDAEAVLFTSRQERELAGTSFKPYRCTEEIVRYGTLAPPGDREKCRKLFCERFPAVRGKEVLLFIGRLHEKKGCGLLLQAFARNASRLPGMVLVMAGSGEKNYVERLKSRAVLLGIRDKVVWTDMLEGREKWGAFFNAELFVLPSHQENFGIAVAEALGSGVPVLISDKVNIWEDILNAGAGIVANDDADSLSSALAEWSRTDGKKREVMSDSAIRCFKENFEIHAAADSLIKVIQTHMKRFDEPKGG